MEIVTLLGITLVVFGLPLFALSRGKLWLAALLPIYLITANVFVESFLTVFGQLTSLAIPVYAATFLITDTLSEHFGKPDAKRAVLIGFMGQLIFLAMTILVSNAPIFPEKAEAFRTVFAIMPRVIVGSFVAYLVSQFWDIHIYHLIRTKTGRGVRLLWLRNNISTITSQFIDTWIFLTIAFYGRVDNFVGFFLTTWFIKMIIAALDTPYLYLTYKVIGRGGRG